MVCRSPEVAGLHGLIMSMDAVQCVLATDLFRQGKLSDHRCFTCDCCAGQQSEEHVSRHQVSR